ncbi:MAG: hypothetical protein CBARDCOR_0367 [uncultured Caballeronia sp.]|nr:MAG: hypothetical protein CBARDCOR_0367 [uncultured Caballeronia sp.]
MDENPLTVHGGNDFSCVNVIAPFALDLHILLALCFLYFSKSTTNIALLLNEAMGIHHDKTQEASAGPVYRQVSYKPDGGRSFSLLSQPFQNRLNRLSQFAMIIDGERLEAHRRCSLN